MSFSSVLYPFRVPLWIARFVVSALRERSGAFLRYQPGYHGSTIPSRKFIERHRGRLFDPPQAEDGIDLNRAGQQRLLATFQSLPFDPPEHPVEGRLYYYDNAMFSFPDAFALHGMLRTFQPKRVIEVGSGHSSALMLDCAREFLPETRFTFIDPYSRTIQDVLASRPEGHYELLRTEVQDIDLDVFRSLEAGDILFLDTSHAVKIGSDVSALFFHVLPALKPGVLVHVHDIFWPWEYPEEFVLEGRTYNEVYFVRAFLQFNNAFEILFNGSQMEKEHPGAIPVRAAGVRTSQSLWLRKTR